MSKIEPVPTQIVTVPDGEDMRPRNVEGVGVVRPGVVRQLVRQEMVARGMWPSRKERRRLERLRNAPPVRGPRVVVRPRLSERETTDRMAALLLDEYNRHQAVFPAGTIEQFLDDKAAKEVEEAFRAGRPIDRDSVRRAIGELWVQTQRQQKGAT